MDGRTRVAVVAGVVLALILAATSVLAIVRTQQVRTAQQREEKLQRQLADARNRISELESSEGTSNGSSTIPEGLEDLFGEDGIFGGDGNLEDLFGDGALEELFGDLFGEGGGLDGLGGAADLAACVQEDESVDIDDTSGQAQFDDIEQAVSTLRDLSFSEDVEPTYLSQAEIAERITDSIEEDYSAEEADIDRRYLAALGAIDPDLDMLQAQKDLLGEQVAGFYDSDTGEMVVGTADPGEALNPTDQVTLAHELTHAVTDQQLGLPELLDDDLPDTDAALAALAVVEGDATLAMQRFATSALSVTEQLGLAADPRAAQAQQQLAEFPYVLQQQLRFPYERGLAFACALSREGGWDAVNAAYESLPPTTAQVLFPQRYGEPAPDEPTAPSAPGDSWEEARTDTLGAAELKWLFEAPGDDPQAALSEPLQRVAHWDASIARLWTDGEATALGVTFRDRGGEGPSLCESVTAWYDAAFPDDREVELSGQEQLATEGGAQSAVVSCPGEEVRFAVAPDLATARQIAS